MKTNPLLSLLAGLLLCSCASQPVEKYTFNAATGNIDTIKPPSAFLYTMAGLVSTLGHANFSSGALDISPVSLGDLGHCPAGAK